MTRQTKTRDPNKAFIAPPRGGDGHSLGLTRDGVRIGTEEANVKAFVKLVWVVRLAAGLVLLLPVAARVAEGIVESDSAAVARG